LGSATIRYSSFIMLICAIGSQLTDVSIGPLKAWEVFAITIFAVSIRTVNKKFLPYILFFSLLLVTSIIASFMTDAKFDDYGGLKSKYIISAVRFIELMLCILTAMTVFTAAQKYKLDTMDLITKFLRYNFLITIVVLIIFCADLVLKTKIVTYGVARLTGFYVEGGPYGLFMSTLIFLQLISGKNKKSHLFIFTLALILAQSKAAIVGLLILVIINLMIKNKTLSSFLNPRNIVRFSISMLLFISAALFTTYNIAYNYIEDIKESSHTINEKAYDKSFVMGRVAAYNIGPRIFLDNPLFGVGLGTYSLVRNDPKYSGNFPRVEDWDLTGLGGFFNLIVENGLFGLLGFIIITFRFFRFDAIGIAFFSLFIIPFALGAQLYMVYPWIYLGMYASLVNYKKRESCNQPV
jgi:hypothetical protein